MDNTFAGEEVGEIRSAQKQWARGKAGRQHRSWRSPCGEESFPGVGPGAETNDWGCIKRLPEPAAKTGHEIYFEPERRIAVFLKIDLLTRSEERRVGKECRSRWS